MRPRLTEAIYNLSGSDFLSSLVPTGAVMYVLAMLAVMVVFVRRCKTVQLSTYHELGAIIWAIIAGLIGARVFHLIEELEYTLYHPGVIFDLTGGTTSWGAYLGGFTGFLIYFLIKKVPLLSSADVLASSLGLGPFLGRWSCFLNSCCYGTVTDLPWAVQYPVDSYPYIANVRMGLISAGAPLSPPVHPVQIYSSLAGLLLFLLVSIYWYRYKEFKGTTFAVYWLLYALFRFTIEFFRADVSHISLLNLTLAQYICILIACSSAVFLSYKYYRITSKTLIRDKV